MKFIFSFITFLAIGTCFSQDINWKETKNWRLYDIHQSNAFDYKLDTLKNFESIALDQDTMQNFLSDVVKWPKDKTSLWMGLYVATCEFPNRKIRKIDISVYGGFFYDEMTRTYYQLPLATRNDWLEYLSVNSAKIDHLIKDNEGVF